MFIVNPPKFSARFRRASPNGFLTRLRFWPVLAPLGPGISYNFFPLSVATPARSASWPVGSKKYTRPQIPPRLQEVPPIFQFPWFFEGDLSPKPSSLARARDCSTLLHPLVRCRDPLFSPFWECFQPPLHPPPRGPLPTKPNPRCSFVFFGNPSTSSNQDHRKVVGWCF